VLNVANDGSTLYSNSGRISSTFAAGVKLSVEAIFYPVANHQNCTYPPGNIVVSYTVP